MPTFNERVQALPSELYNKVYDLTLTPSSSIVFIKKGYQPPTLMSINRATREQFAQAYYGSDMIFSGDRKAIAYWLESLDAADHKLWCEIRVIGRVFGTRPFSFFGLWDSMKQETDYVTSLISAAFAKEVKRALRFQVKYGSPEKQSWISFKHIGEGLAVFEPKDGAEEFCEWKFGK